LTSPMYTNLLRMWLTNEYYHSQLIHGPRIPFVRD
jgi:hypothetical protein